MAIYWRRLIRWGVLCCSFLVCLFVLFLFFVYFSVFFVGLVCIKYLGAIPFYDIIWFFFAVNRDPFLSSLFFMEHIVSILRQKVYLYSLASFVVCDAGFSQII